MRVIKVDERDSTWERGDPHFRIYVFEGAHNAVDTFDILDATVEQALESAHALAHGNERLWALALVEDDPRGMRGLLWLSGMDYNDVPITAREWQRRRQMQDRFLSEKNRRGLACVLPNGLRVIRFFRSGSADGPCGRALLMITDSLVLISVSRRPSVTHSTNGMRPGWTATLTPPNQMAGDSAAVSL